MPIIFIAMEKKSHVWMPPHTPLKIMIEKRELPTPAITAFNAEGNESSPVNIVIS